MTACAPRRVFSRTLAVLACCLAVLAARCAWQQNPLAIALGVLSVVSYAVALYYGRRDVPFLAGAFPATVLFGIVRLVWGM